MIIHVACDILSTNKCPRILRLKRCQQPNLDTLHVCTCIVQMPDADLFMTEFVFYTN